MKRITALWIAVILLISCAVPAAGYTVSDAAVIGSDAVVACNGSGLYLVSFSGRNLHMERPAPDGFSDDLTLSYPIAHAAVFGDTVAAVCNDYANEQTIVYTYEISTGIPDSFAVPHYTYGYHRGFYLDAHGLLIQDDEHPALVHRYGYGAAMTDSHDFQASAVSFVYGYNGELYICCDGRLYRYNGSGYVALSGEYVSSPAVFIADDLILDSDGWIYRLDGDSVRSVMRVDSNGVFPAGAVLNGAYYTVSGTAIYRYDPAAQSRTDSFDAGCPIRALYAWNGELCAVTDGSAPAVVRVSPAEFTPCETSQELPAVFPFSSSLYRINAADFRITRIPSATTFAQLKAGITHDGYQAQLYRDGKTVKSGSVGTAMTLRFSGADTYTFELSVIGDITGEGNVNSRDVGELMDYFLGNIRFDGVYADAADISDDGKLSMLDLALLCRLANQ